MVCHIKSLKVFVANNIKRYPILEEFTNFPMIYVLYIDA